ncbi:MAG TPA: hypothetical protein VEC14_16040 [Reyranellaceae bacterium]|nr:hypothetical protein [Reyranellaceae bacterium]
MNSSVTRRKSALTLVDFLVIAATVLTFLAVVAINDSRKSRTSYLLQDTSAQTGLAYNQGDLVKARVRIATSGL